MGAPANEITLLLRAWSDGNPEALQQLTPLVYGELRRIARRYMRREGNGNSLQTTALVNEAYLKMIDVQGVGWQGRSHFFAISAQIMRRILVDAARARGAEKRGGGVRQLNLDESIDGTSIRDEKLVGLDEALNTLSKFDPRKARVVEMRFFGGLSTEEIAEVLKISPRSVKRDWKLARAWLCQELQ